MRSSNKCNVQATSSGCVCKCKSIWGGGRLTFVMGVQEQVRRITVKVALVPVLEKAQSICVYTPLPLLIWGVRGQSGVGSPSTRLVLMWLVCTLLLLIMAKNPKLPYIWMVLGVALSLVIALMGSLALGVQHMMSPFPLLSLSP